jgi:hypothetical protein
MNSAILPPEDVAVLPQGLRAPSLPGCFPYGRLENSLSFISQNLLGAGIPREPGLAHITEFACGRGHVVGRCPHGGSRELPEAYAENFIGLSR